MPTREENVRGINRAGWSSKCSWQWSECNLWCSIRKMVTYDRGGRSESRIYLFDPLMGSCNNDHLPSKDRSQIPMFHVNNVQVGTRPPIRLSLMFQITWSWPSPKRHAQRMELTSSNSCPMNLASYLSKLSKCSRLVGKSL